MVVVVPVVGVLVEAAAAGEDDERHLGVAQDGELVGLFEEPVPALAEGHLPASRVLDPLDLNPSPPHLDLFLVSARNSAKHADPSIDQGRCVVLYTTRAYIAPLYSTISSYL